ncbi:MAG: hypothetical protein L0L10_10900 [Tetragenococcus sp.]|nr:hypothetical protein [Tetragenococcus sp.]
MNIEQIKEELTMLEGHLLQLAIDETDGSIGGINNFLNSVIDEGFEEDYQVLVRLASEAKETVQHEIKYIKPFE